MAKKKSEDKSHEKEDNTNNGIDQDEEANFSDPEGFVDDITDEELLGDILVSKPKTTDGVESVIVVDGVPQVGPERFERLQKVIHKLFGKFGPLVNEYYPKDENGITKGYFFIEYANPLIAQDAVSVTDNYHLDKTYTFRVNLFTDFSKYEDIPDEWEPPEPEPRESPPDLYNYLLEPDAYDQFVVFFSGKERGVQFWQNSQPEPTMLEKRPNFSQTYVKWSPLGTYLTTFYTQGIALWGGTTFTKLKQLRHNGVEFADFSPCEKYLVTYSPQHNNDQKSLTVWDIRTGDQQRTFATDGPTIWPILRWSHDGKYFARMSTDTLSVYSTPTFGLLKNKSLSIPGIRDFSWSPTDNILAYWVAENKDVPAQVTLVEIPNRIELRKKNLFHVADCRIHWQKSGDYLCVKVDRYAKRVEKTERKYTGMFCNFEIFHIREKDIPVDSVEIKEPVHAFAWEPVGLKFAIIHGEQASINVSFYKLKTGQAPLLLKKFEKKACNHLFWSPQGQFIVLAGLGNLGGALEFVDTNDFTIMNITEHYETTDVEWDPTGRYVVTAVSVWKVKRDSGYWIWSFQGKILKRINYDGFAQLLWRPRPPTLLSSKQQKEIKKNLKKYYAQFESKDRMRMTKASKELIEKRASLMKEFEELRQERLKQWKEQKPLRLELRNRVDTDELDSDTKNVEEEVVEFFIKEEVTVID